MISRNSRKMTRRTALMTSAPMAALASSTALGAGDAAQPGSKGHGKMVFVLTTGLEDLMSIGAALAHSVLAHESGFLDNTTLLVYGRSVQAFDRAITAKPPSIPQAIQKAADAGVRIILCAEALQKFNIPHDRLEPGVAEVVPNTIPTLAELVSKGYQIIRY